MKYILNNRLIFNSDDCSVFAVGHDIYAEPLFLSPPGSRLLEIFITHNNQCLSRDLLLEKVWDRYGLTSSGNNLNNLVSAVRRLLAKFEITGAIVTHPKVGFSAGFESIYYDKINVPLREVKTTQYGILNPFLAITIILVLFKYGEVLKENDRSYFFSIKKIGDYEVCFNRCSETGGSAVPDCYITLCDRKNNDACEKTRCYLNKPLALMPVIKIKNEA